MCIIGITTSFKTIKVIKEKTSRNYLDAVTFNGGKPLVLTPETVKNGFEGFDFLDGLIITGGFDVDPDLFGQKPHEELSDLDTERDKMEIGLLKHFIETKKPVLGICRGMQIINTLLGGSLEQHIDSDIQHNQEEENSKPTHQVSFVEGSGLEEIFGSKTIAVNSHHHQRIDELGEGLKVEALAPDKTIEAVTHKKFENLIGVQWHPEMMYRNNLEQKKLFEKFLEISRNN